MSCAWFEEKVVQPEVELWRNGRPSGALLEHARHCRECAGTIDREARVKMLLLALGESTQTAEPGPQVKTRLLQELEERKAQPRLRRPKWAEVLRSRPLRWSFAGAGALVAAGLIVGAILNWPARSLKKPALQTPAVRAAESQSPAVLQPKVLVAQAANPVRKKTPATSGRSKAALPRVSNVADAGYYPMVMCDSYTCGGDAVEIRVDMPVSPLWGGGSVGAGRNVRAQLLVGEDGFVRGIKFLH